jgi:hypothetical protein
VGYGLSKLRLVPVSSTEIAIRDVDSRDVPPGGAAKFAFVARSDGWFTGTSREGNCQHPDGFFKAAMWCDGQQEATFRC